MMTLVLVFVQMVDLHVCVCGSTHCGCMVNGSVAMAAV